MNKQPQSALCTVPMDIIIACMVMTPYLRTCDAQHLFWTCKLFSLSDRLLTAIQDKRKANFIAAGGASTYAYTDGELYGVNYTSGKLEIIPIPANIQLKSIVIRDCAFMLCTDGQLYVHGFATSKLGLGHIAKHSLEMQNSLRAVLIPGSKKVQSITVGKSHTVALCTDGSVYAWGLNDSGQLGLGNTQDQNTPQRVLISAKQEDQKVQSIVAGDNYTVALCTDGSVYTWGSNFYGQLGVGNTQNQETPQRVSIEGKKVKNIATGGCYTAAVCTDGTVYTWGSNFGGRLGLNHQQDQNTPQRVRIADDKEVQSVSTRKDFMVALCADGSLYAWGDNCGIANGRATAPQAIVMPEGSKVHSIISGDEHIVISCTDGSLYTWGGKYRSGYRGSCANESWHLSAVVVPEGKKVQSITAGSFHSVIACVDGSTYIWGAHGAGQLYTSLPY